MKTQACWLSVAGLFFAAGASHAAQPSELQRYADRAQAQAQKLLGGLDVKTGSVSVRATVNPDGHLSGIQVMRSSGSRSVDLAAETVLRKIVVADPPLGLTDGAVVLKVSGAPVLQAKTP